MRRVVAMFGVLMGALAFLTVFAAASDAQHRLRRETRARVERPVITLSPRERLRLLVREHSGERLQRWRDRLEERRAQSDEMFEFGPRRERFLKREILVLEPSEDALARAQAMNMVIVRERTFSALGLKIVVLRAPPGMTAFAARQALQDADPAGVYELNHVFGPSAAEAAFLPQQGCLSRDCFLRSRAEPSLVQVSAKPAPSVSRGIKIGMIDTGADLSHPALKGARITARSFPAGSRPEPAPHGTAVASLLVGRDGPFEGAATGATLLLADVFGDRPEGGSAEAIAEALGWMADEGARVVNVSLAGPPNRILELVCQRASARGIALVAAVGNDGPTSPVAFPAAYPGVIAVTAIDEQSRVYVAANRGPEVAFAALGVHVVAAVDGGEYADVSGTSFAAPVVAARLAAIGEPKMETLAARARDLGPPGRDPVYGFGDVD